MIDSIRHTGSRAAILAVMCVAVGGACSSAARTQLPEDQRAAIADSLRHLARGRMDAANRRDGAAIMSYYADDPRLVWAENGSLYTDREWIAREVGAHYAGLSEMRGTWDSIHVAVLSPNSAVLTGTYSSTSTDTAGETRSSRGARTWVFSRVDGVWKIIHTHESHPLAPSATDIP